MKCAIPAILAATTLAVAARADVIIDQPRDGLNDVISYWQSNLPCVQGGDDYQPSRPTIVTSVTFWLIASYPAVPYNWSFAVHTSTDDHPTRGFAPEYPWIHFQTGPTSVTDLGEWKPRPGTHLFEVTFDDVNLLLDPADSERGTFWFSPGGWTPDTNVTKSWWITSGDGEVNGYETWSKIFPYSYPGWRPLSAGGRRDPSDYAMRIEGYAVPAPSAVALVMLGGFARRSRRRR